MKWKKKLKSSPFPLTGAECLCFDNILHFASSSSAVIYVTVHILLSSTYFLPQETVEETVPVSGSSAGVNALGLVVFSMCFGLVIGNMKQKGQALRDFFDCLNEAIMRLVSIIIWSVKTYLTLPKL